MDNHTLKMDNHTLKNDIFIEEEMKRSYLDYAMSVITDRALPDIRDGLKPVHRRILYAMHELHNDSNKQYKKSARIVGNVIGQYHPHGENAVYESIVRMAQSFTLRYPLIDGQGNFGSMDGDPAAAMRYTEIRLTKLSHEFLVDIDKETVKLTDNYDGTMQEPSVLPTKVPNLLVNGSSGIAVGMATNIPSHNIIEVSNALIAVLENPNIELDDLLKHLPGPDFPTKGFIYGIEGIKSAYSTGKGIICIRGKADIEINPNNKKTLIVISELPYQVSKINLLKHIVELIKTKKINGIGDIRDESDKDGLRLVFEIKKDGNPKLILNQLYIFSNLQTSFGIILLAIVNKRPRVLTLKQILQLFIDYRKEIVTKQTIYNLKKAELRINILNGFKIALENFGTVIKIIQTEKTPISACLRLMNELFVKKDQANAILDMRLHKFTNMEKVKLLNEHKYITDNILKLNNILSSNELIQEIIKNDLLELISKFGDKRCTKIIQFEEHIKTEDIIIEEQVIVTFSHTDYIKCSPAAFYHIQKRGGKGKIGMTTKSEDFVKHLFVASTHDYLLIFTSFGKLYWLRVFDIHQTSRISRGKSIVNLLNLHKSETVSSVLTVSNFINGYNIIIATSNGYIKKTNLMSFSKPRVGGIIAINICNDNKVVSIQRTSGDAEVFLTTRYGKTIRFKESDIRTTGRASIGVKGIRLEKDDKVIAIETVNNDISTFLTITANGYGKRTNVKDYPLQSRFGKGVITIKTTKRNGNVIGCLAVSNSDEVMLISNTGKIIRINVKDIRVIGRNTQGVKLINLDKNEFLVSVARLADIKK